MAYTTPARSAFFFGMGPTVQSASLLTMITCFPWSMASMAWRAADTLIPWDYRAPATQPHRHIHGQACSGWRVWPHGPPAIPTAAPPSSAIA